MEGTRPILVELQALTSGTNFGTPRRTILGLDPNRVALLAAVMEKKIGMHLMGYDIFMNVAGGVRVDRTGCGSRDRGGDRLELSRQARVPTARWSWERSA